MTRSDRWQRPPEGATFGLADFLPSLIRQNGIRDVLLRRLARGPSLQGRTQDPQVLALADLARARSEKDGTPFWESMMSLARSEPLEIRTTVFKEALYHRQDSDGVEEFWMSSEDFLSVVSGPGFEETDARSITALTSLVRNSTSETHLPLLDFRIAPSPESTILLTELLTILKTDGYLVNSGRSYHFYGGRTLTADDFWKFLGRSQLMAPFVDDRWIAHQLISSKAALRISTNAERHTSPPKLVAWSGRFGAHLQ